MRLFAAILALATIAACSDKTSSTPNAGPPASPALLHPDQAKLDAQAPDSFVMHFVTSKGDFDVEVHRDWAPHGADRLYYLASNGFYDGVRFFRVLDGFMAQFGINGNPAVTDVWHEKRIPDDPVKESNKRGVLTFATAGPNTRTTQLFINYKDNTSLDGQGFAGVGEVTDNGMAVVDSLYGGYGEGAPDGQGPDQTKVESDGNSYLARSFPKLDSVVTARVTRSWPPR